ncbi:MAG TPA: SRPBCC family protein [Bryobacteraceae bacterium]|nr:SRPBCC family protein [Bryobacteraceae bacterium]
MTKNTVAGFAAGAALMYFADPDRGRRRRALARDKFLAGVRDVRNEFDKAGRDFRNRSHGVAAGVSSLWKTDEADGPVLVERVRSAIGRAVSHPHAVRARAGANGSITLEGPVLRHEVDYLIRRVQAVRGVREVIDRLEVHDEAGGVSSLQGGVPRRALSALAQQNWTPSLRVATGALAGAALCAGARQRGPLGWASIAAGAVLLARGIINKPFRQMLGIGPGAGAVTFEKTVHIDAPLEEVYAFWANFENFPKFMSHLKEVRHRANGRSHWVAAGPGGISIPWDAEITGQKSNELLAWKSVPGSMVDTAGQIRFDKESDGRARVQIRMSYCPPAGMFGHAVAWMFGADPKSEIDDDMARLKSLLETGKTRAHGLKVTRDQVAISRSM